MRFLSEALLRPLVWIEENGSCLVQRLCLPVALAREDPQSLHFQRKIGRTAKNQIKALIGDQAMTAGANVAADRLD